MGCCSPAPAAAYYSRFSTTVLALLEELATAASVTMRVMMTVVRVVESRVGQLVESDQYGQLSPIVVQPVTMSADQHAVGHVFGLVAEWLAVHVTADAILAVILAATGARAVVGTVVRSPGSSLC